MSSKRTMRKLDDSGTDQELTSVDRDSSGLHLLPGKLQVLILGSEWGSSKGGLSTINRELAVNLAKCPEVDVTFFVPQCSDEEKEVARTHNIDLIKAKRRPGMTELQWLLRPPTDLHIDVVVGHGVHLGPQAQFIRDTRKCRWIQVVHKNPEEIGMFKTGLDPVSESEKEHEDEIALCKEADFVLTVGPKLAEAFRAYLRSCTQTIFEFTPGILQDVSKVHQVANEGNKFRVLLCGRGNTQDFSLQGFDIAAKAVAALSDFHLLYVGAEGNENEIKKRFLECGISAKSLTVRSTLKNRESLNELLCEVDLAVMPTRTDGFGVIGLEALSAGLPVLVSRNTGFGEALSKVPFGSYFVIDSDEAQVWAKMIKDVWGKDRRDRLKESEALRTLYKEKYSWEKQSRELIREMARMIQDAHGSRRSSTKQRTSPQTEDTTEDDSGTLQIEFAMNSATFEEPQSEDLQRVMCEMARDFIDTRAPSIPASVMPESFYYYLVAVRDVKVKHASFSSLRVTVECKTLDVLDSLWKDYRSGNLNAEAEKRLLTDGIKKRFHVDSVKLKTTIRPVDYLACKLFLTSFPQSDQDQITDETQTQSVGEPEPVIQHADVKCISDTSSVSSEALQAPDDECLYATVGRKPTGRRNFNVTDRPSWPSQPIGLSDTSSLSSEASQAPDECLNGTVAGRKPTGRRNFNVRVYGSNNVTVGPKSKIVHLDPTQRRESETGRQYDRVPEEVNIRVVENIPDSYCVKSAHGLKRMERDEEWNPRPTKGIILNEDPENYTYTVDAFFNNPDQFIQEMDKCGGSCKEQREQFILLKVLPHLEEMWGKCSSSNEEVYKNLAKISCSVNSGTVVRHALHLLLRLVCKDNLGSGNGKLQVAEGVLRSSIVSPEGRLRKDEHSEEQLKLFVYSRILTLLFIQLQQEQLSLLALELELKEVKKILKVYSEKHQHIKKDVFRYAMEYIIKIIPYLLQPHEKSKVKGLITECQEFCGHHHIKSEGILETVKKIPKREWVDLHCILIYLQGKMHNESPIAQMESELRAMKLFGLIVGTCLEERRWGSDWKFCLIALPILADIANSNITKEMRKEANSCLEKLLKDAEVQKKPESRIILEQQLSKFVFCKDVETRKLLVEFWFNDLDPPNHLPAAYHTKHLSSMYRTQTLEINETFVCKKSACFVNHGMFHRQKVAIKVLYANKRHLLEDDPNFKDRQRLIREVYNMGRLNASQHPNFPVLLGYDTKTLPYHLITAFERWGNLLQLVRLSRDKREPHLTPNDVIEMILGISQALSFLEGRGFVHRAVMAENVLVGSNFVCKLSGLHFMRQLRSPLSDEDVDTEDGYCSPNQFIPEYFSTSGEEDPPVRWRAPECLTKNRYSTASDVWAFGVLMYEVLSFGRVPYEDVPNDDALHICIVDHKEIVPRESCFEDKEYELIKQFCEWESNYRLRRFTKVIERLQELLQHQQRYSENVRRSPPGSTEHIQSQGSRTAPSPDLEGEARCDLIRKTGEGQTSVREKISNDFLHVKGLLELKHPNLVSVESSEIMDDSGLYWIISPECPNENLKDYVLNRQCKLKHIVMFLSQVASALHYLHVRHIVHGDLRAEYVNVVAPDKVKVGRLGRSKHLSMNVDDKGTSKLCVKQADMSPDAHRWSAPEVISDGLYTHASDVWAFGILAWELYTSFTKGQDRRDLSVPYCGLYKDEILPYMRKTGPLDKPEDCPYWVYAIMHQCWTFSSGQRPPFLAIFDCLTSREPMKSWLMERWKQRKGKESDFPDLSILQEEDASHVLGKEEHPSKEDIERMCLEGFFTEHGYRYVRDESNENGENLQVDESGIRRMEVVSVEKQADESNSITENKTGAHHQTSGDVTRLTNFSTKESEAACSDSEVTGFHVMPQNEDPGNYSPCQQHDGQGGCTSEYPIGSCAERRDEENIDCEIYDDVMPKQEALEPQHVPPGNYTTAVEHRADFEDEHQSNIEGGCQNVPQQNATQIVAEGTDRGRGPNVSQALKPQHVLPENYPTGVQDLLNDPCTWEVFV